MHSNVVSPNILIPHTGISGKQFINIKTPTPDIPVERPVISELELANLGLGMENTKVDLDLNKKEHRSKIIKHEQNKFRINIITIIMSALIFLVLLTWFDFFQTVFYTYTNPNVIYEIPSTSKFWYAMLMTFIVIMIILIFYITSITIHLI